MMAILTALITSADDDRHLASEASCAACQRCLPATISLV
jgi:hypothetical protein